MTNNTLSNINIFSQISHEIKTPLTCILGLLDILRETDLNKEQKSYLDDISMSADELKNLDEKIKVMLSKYMMRTIPASLKKPKILLVEDNKIVRMVNKALIEKISGDSIDITENGMSAILQTTKKNYDLIFMDIGLPDINGCEVTKKIRCLEKSKSTIIGLTAFDLHDVKEECLNSGMDMVINKPADPDFLRKLITSCAEKLNEDFFRFNLSVTAS
jgi:CheY-like chemotaxis protein